MVGVFCDVGINIYILFPPVPLSKWLKTAHITLEFKELGSSVSTGRWLLAEGQVDRGCVPAEEITGDKNVSVHLMITIKNTPKYFKQFQSLTVIA
jgi:hypothetical protein